MTDQVPHGDAKGEAPDEERARRFRIPLPRLTTGTWLPLVYLAAFLVLSIVLFPPT